MKLPQELQNFDGATFSSSENCDCFAISTRFTQGRHRRLLVVDEGRLVGLISRRDVMRALEAMEQTLSRSGGKTTYELIDERHQKLD